MRIARGGDVLVPGRKGDLVQYIDVRDLAEWMVGLIERDASGTFNAVGPAAAQTMAEFVEGLRPLADGPLTYVWIEDYDWLKKYPLRKPADDDTTGLTYAIAWAAPLRADFRAGARDGGGVESQGHALTQSARTGS